MVLPPILILGLVAFFETQALFRRDQERVFTEQIDHVTAIANRNIEQVDRSAQALTFNTGLAVFFETDYAGTSGIYGVYEALRDVFDPSISYTVGINGMIQKVVFYTDSPQAGVRENIISLREQNVPRYIRQYRMQEDPQWIKSNGRLYVLSQFPDATRVRTIVALEIDADLFQKQVVLADNTVQTGLYQGSRYLFGADIPAATGNRIRTVHLNNTDWSIRGKAQPAGMTKYGRNVILVMAFFLCLSVLFVVLISRFFTKQILGIIDDLRLKVQAVTNQDFNVDFHSDQQDELGNLSNLIGTMMESIKRLITEVFQTKIYKQESEYNALVNQINSHFLYNTLSMINWQAIMSGNEESSRVIQTLSTFYRTTVNNGRAETKLKLEINNIQAYIALQLYLQPKLFTVTYHVDDTLLEYSVINLMIQPLVENVIEHGFQKLPKDAHIDLTVKRSGSAAMTITVADNGQGIAPEQADQILEQNTRGYGLKNVDRRIKFYFGEQYGLTITSKPGIGTQATIKLPLTSTIQPASEEYDVLAALAHGRHE
ncbi:sensor histidine kinase [Schleiferilactobacillus harbinensis]|uniref:sensor histidine kinase n=1 Tax=Schleiferilactobacillus harbinensis TaxID=304207 RepID=UPI002671F3C9|nr:histidine kinase [Schleiferilactobacillus harbinensis]